MAFLDAIFPPVCAGCGRRGHWVCRGCKPSIPPILVTACPRCGALRLDGCACADLPDQVIEVRSALPFDGWVQSSIHALKYEGERARARHLGDLLLPLVGGPADVDVIVPVPLHPDRLRHRGFNQSTLLAQRLRCHLPAVEIVEIGRRGSRVPQVGLGWEERRTNVVDAFFLSDAAVSAIAKRRVVLLDDVITTTATIAACATALVDAGATSIRCVSVARAV